MYSRNRCRRRDCANGPLFTMRSNCPRMAFSSGSLQELGAVAVMPKLRDCGSFTQHLGPVAHRCILGPTGLACHASDLAGLICDDRSLAMQLSPHAVVPGACHHLKRRKDIMNFKQLFAAVPLALLVLGQQRGKG